MIAVTCWPVLAGDESKTARTTTAKRRKETSNLLSSQEFWSLFQNMKAEAKDLPTGGSVLVPKNAEKGIGIRSLLPRKNIWRGRIRHATSAFSDLHGESVKA